MPVFFVFRIRLSSYLHLFSEDIFLKQKQDKQQYYNKLYIKPIQITIKV